MCSYSRIFVIFFIFFFCSCFAFALRSYCYVCLARDHIGVIKAFEEHRITRSSIDPFTQRSCFFCPMLSTSIKIHCMISSSIRFFTLTLVNDHVNMQWKNKREEKRKRKNTKDYYQHSYIFKSIIYYCVISNFSGVFTLYVNIENN